MSLTRCSWPDEVASAEQALHKDAFFERSRYVLNVECIVLKDCLYRRAWTDPYKLHLCHCVPVAAGARLNGIDSHFAMLAFHLRYIPELTTVPLQSTTPRENAM